MGGSSIDDDWEFTSPSNVVRTLVLVGRTGNGKSATGNSILQKKAFISRRSTGGVTSTCEMHRTVLNDGQILNVIDTPGLFDVCAEPEFLGKEIVKCINMAKDGIHAVLLVISLQGRFSLEEKAAISSLRTFFGNKITDYMVIVFTGGDELENDDETLESYLAHDCVEPLKELLNLCGNRKVLFDNRTKDPVKQEEQIQELLSHVNTIVAANGGKPYIDEMFVELKKGAIKLQNQTEEVKMSEKYSDEEISKLTGQMHIAYEDQLKRLTEMVESKLREATSRLEKQLAEEQVARLNAEKMALDAQMKSNDEILELRKSLEKAHQEAAALRQLQEKHKCVIL